MLTNKGFDKWSGAYDEDILKKQDKGYPFEGYYRTLGYIQNIVDSTKKKRVLDIGIGTGLLTETLYNAGSKITGVDFSSQMLEQAKAKMPQGRFIRFDFNLGLPKELCQEKFDYIISSYAIHHINDEQKISFFIKLLGNLCDTGQILIGDIAFETRADMDRVMLQSDNWDDAEHYMIAEDLISTLTRRQLNAAFVKTSNCSGVLVIQPK